MRCTRWGELLVVLDTLPRPDASSLLSSRSLVVNNRGCPTTRGVVRGESFVILVV